MDDHPRNPEELLQDDSFIRWIRDCADAQEKAFWENWINRTPRNRKLAEEAERILQAMQFKRADTSDMEEELNKLNARIDSEIPALQQSAPNQRRNNLFRYVAAAAVALIIFTTGLLVLDQPFYSSDQLAKVPVQTKIKEQVFKTNTTPYDQETPGNKIGEISTGFAERTTLVFDDGSKVFLNANSSLEYPTGNTAQGDISVRLQGEAYFDIAERNAENKRTFTVRTENGSVNVLGTKFTVQADDRHTEVALQEGVVEVKKKGIDSEKTKYTMKPGELAKVSKLSSSINVEEINPSVYFSWTRNKLQFDNTSLAKISQRIEKTYGVKVIVKNPLLMERKISGSIQNNDLDVLLDALSELLQTPIERTENTITIGT